MGSVLATPGAAGDNACDVAVTEPAQRRAADELERARDAYASRAWLEAYEAFSRADEEAPLEAEDLELLTTATLMLGRDDDAIGVLERAHHRYLERGETLRAVRSATWIGMNLAYRGAVGAASGWLGRAQRLLDQEPGESAEHGYLLIPLVFQREAAGDFEADAAVAGQAAAIGERFGDRDLFSMSLHAQGHMLVRAGRVGEGLALLDEAMVAVTTEDLSPVVSGVVYCAVILTCQEVFELRRAREWTLALDRWCRQQPDMVAFTGRCLVHRAEILQLGGSWPDALEEARRAGRRFVETNNPTAGLALYREAELLRLQGGFDSAEEAYRAASAAGREPQPGLAQLRLAQGRVDASVAAIRRAVAERSDLLRRAELLPAHVEIMLAAGELDEARAACNELETVAGRYSSAMLDAIVAYERGAVELAAGDARRALGLLRRALDAWRTLDAPYEVARTRVLIGGACRALDDTDACVLELEAALADFVRLGAVPDAARVERLLGRPQDGAGHGLSPRELEVLRLVAAGKTNREIAAASRDQRAHRRQTRPEHLGKLRVSSRAAATAFAFEHDLV